MKGLTKGSWSLEICTQRQNTVHRTFSVYEGTPHLGQSIIPLIHHSQVIRDRHWTDGTRFIDWGLQNQYDEDGNEITPRPTKPGDEEDEERFAAWREGRTGFPSVPLPPLMPIYSHLLISGRWIDACMRQLKYEGWIHHLARHSVACFITRGQCYISWERGMEVFDGEICFISWS